MDSEAKVNFIININRSSKITVNAASDLIRNQLIYFCNKLGTLFDPEIKCAINHDCNAVKYQYIYSLEVANSAYAGAEGELIIESFLKLYRNVLSISDLKEKSIDRFISNRDVGFAQLSDLIGRKINKDETDELMKLERRLASGINGSWIKAELFFGYRASSRNVNVDNGINGDLFTVAKNVGGNEQLQVNEPKGNLSNSENEDSFSEIEVNRTITVGNDYKISRICFDGKTPSILLLEKFPTYIAFDRKLIELLRSACRKIIGESMTLEPTSDDYGQSCVYSSVDPDPKSAD